MNLSLVLSERILTSSTSAQLGCDMLKEGGSLYFEINRAYGEETMLMLKKLGYVQIELKKDSWGNDRMIKAKR